MKMRIALLILLWFSSFLRAEYKELSDIKKYSLLELQQYAKRLSSVDPEFEGVVNFGKSLQSIKDANDVNVPKLTVTNKDYWRAVLEMVPTDPSILFAHAYLYAARGEIEYAKTYFILGRLTMSKEFADELNRYIELDSTLSKRIEKEIQKGIKYHDKGKYAEALKAYDKIISEHPNCAWAFYEKGFSYLMMEKNNPKFKKDKEQMYSECRKRDPFYWQAYQGSEQKVLQKLMVLGTKVLPFASEKKRDISAFKAYAEGCEEMELYPIAAHAQWKLAYLDPENMNSHIRKFLDLLSKCGCKESDFFRDQFKLEQDDTENPMERTRKSVSDTNS